MADDVHDKATRMSVRFIKSWDIQADTTTRPMDFVLPVSQETLDGYAAQAAEFYTPEYDAAHDNAR